jgi:hypothetical protein
MKVLRVAAVLLSILAVDVATQSSPAGTWRAVFVGPEGDRPKMFVDVLLDLKVDETTLTGMAEMGVWPGRAPIADGKIDGNRFTFTWTGLRPAYANGRLFYPRMTFAGILDGNQMTLTMIQNGDRPLEMKGERLVPK